MTGAVPCTCGYLAAIRRETDAALRAVPVEGRPLAAAITDHPVSVEDAVKLLREAEQELSGGEGNHEILGAECGVMADRLEAARRAVPVEGGGGSLDDEIDRRVRLLQYDLTGDQMRAMLEVDDAKLRAMLRELLAVPRPQEGRDDGR